MTDDDIALTAIMAAVRAYGVAVFKAGNDWDRPELATAEATVQDALAYAGAVARQAEHFSVCDDCNDRTETCVRQSQLWAEAATLRKKLEVRE